jgi:predicted nuclease of predicted toxin-antitoxin system
MGDDHGPDTTTESASEWRFLIDENLKPSIATELERHGIAAEYVLDALFEGADDFEDILPYCRKTDSVLVTNNVRDFNATDLTPGDHAGIVIVHDKDRPAREIAAELQRIVAAYPSRDALRGFESADDWSKDR